MKKLPLVLMGILCLTAVITYINAKENNPAILFKEKLTGSVSQGTLVKYGLWTATRDQIVTGSGQGDLLGSPITFMLSVNWRFKESDQRSFINGTWTFASPDSGTISGIFNGKGTTIDEFSGMFVTTQAVRSTGIYSHVKIMGDFRCKFLPLGPYGAGLGYEAWWNGTITQGEL